MSEEDRAMCWALRNPPRGGVKVKLADIRKMLKKKDGQRPGLSAIGKAAKTYKDKKEKRGRKKGTRATTKQEDAAILKAFHKARPPGAGVEAWQIHNQLPSKLRNKISEKTVQRRLAEKDFIPRMKLQKSDWGEKQLAKRVRFAKKNEDKNYQQWQSYCQAVGDFKDFTFYPKELQGRFKRLRSKWTYMTLKERKKPAFFRPKQWFEGKEYLCGALGYFFFLQ